jgi:hypothetical protein
MKKFIIAILGIGCCYMDNIYPNVNQRSLDNFSTGIGSPIVTSSADTLDRHSVSVTERAEYYRTHPLSDRVLLTFPDSESQKGLFINYFMMSYGLLDNFTIGLNLPIQHSQTLRAAKEIYPNDTLSVMHLGNISGVADSSIYSLWRMSKGSDDQLIIGLLTGLNIPTGKTNVRTRQGELFGASDQPGSGAWSPMGGLILSKKWKKLSFNANLFYTQPTKRSQGTILGSFYDYNFAATYSIYEGMKLLNSTISGILEFTGQYGNKDKINGIKSPNSGGNSIYLNPGLRATIKDFSYYFSVGIPIAEKFNGTQTYSQYALYSGMDYSF